MSLNFLICLTSCLAGQYLISKALNVSIGNDASVDFVRYGPNATLNWEAATENASEPLSMIITNNSVRDPGQLTAVALEETIGQRIRKMFAMISKDKQEEERSPFNIFKKVIHGLSRICYLVVRCYCWAWVHDDRYFMCCPECLIKYAFKEMLPGPSVPVNRVAPESDPPPVYTA